MNGDITLRIAIATSTTLEVAAAWMAQESRLVMTPTEAKMRDQLYTRDYAVVALHERGTISSEEYRMLFK